MKIGADPHAGDYNVETLLAKLEEMSDALVALNQQNQTVQWGNIQGGISSQADLNFELNQRVARTEFSVLFNQEIARYSQQLFGR